MLKTLNWRDKIGESLANVGKYGESRYTCPNCLQDLVGVYKGVNICPKCEAPLQCNEVEVPCFIAEIVEGEEKKAAE